MINASPSKNVTPQSAGFVLTGRLVLLYLVLFFGTVFGVNFYMARQAIMTFSGLEDDKPYQEGLRYDTQIAAAREQDKRGWRVDVAVRPIVAGRSTIEVRQADAAGLVTTGVMFDARFIHPSDRSRDHKVDLVKVEPGLYRGDLAIEPGGWDLVLAGHKDGEVLFRSQNRMDLAGAK
jgi:nitrogen fixation protein FixH